MRTGQAWCAFRMVDIFLKMWYKYYEDDIGSWCVRRGGSVSSVAGPPLFGWRVTGQNEHLPSPDGLGKGLILFICLFQCIPE